MGTAIPVYHTKIYGLVRFVTGVNQNKLTFFTLIIAGKSTCKIQKITAERDNLCWFKDDMQENLIDVYRVINTCEISVLPSAGRIRRRLMYGDVKYSCISSIAVVEKSFCLVMRNRGYINH